ncbi:tRNA 2-thiouridine(34) synthase MnmA [Candidatus Wolfebacteria bacterium]|nr:tRNA 2-thiouridine(34) synthase MnmA [Candidatus Wolfebacteria bacterium]
MEKTNKKNKKTVFVGMSGGVDSSVAALLLKNQGYDVVGVFMRCFNLDGCAERDAEDARRVAEKLKIPFYVWDFEEEYKKKVVDYMVDGYRRGLTPNPDIMCNKEIKFGLFLKKALEMGADFVATGHYVKIATSHRGLGFRDKKNLYPIGYTLLAARDAQKDQSYFLWTLTQEQLKHCLFPVGDYFKSEVREMARKAGLPTAEKKDSQGICFLGKITLDEFLSQYLPPKKGVVLNASGEKIGEHQGAQFYTIGQRHLGIKHQVSGIKGNTKPLYVAEKNIKTNTLIVAEDNDNPALYKKEVELTDANFINSDLRFKIQDSRILARIRYRQPLTNAELKINPPGIRRGQIKNSEFRIIFDKPQKFVASGQSAVFYEYKKRPSAKLGLKMLGGGVIV